MDRYVGKNQWPEPNRILKKKATTKISMGTETQSNTPKSTIEYRTEPEITEIDKIFNLYNRDYSPKRNKYTHEEIFRAKQTHTETPEDHREKLFKLEKECDFPEFSNEFSI